MYLVKEIGYTFFNNCKESKIIIFLKIRKIMFSIDDAFSTETGLELAGIVGPVR